MCGLAGLFGTLETEETHQSIETMLGVQAHRGPDSSGIWCGTVHGRNIGLGLCRLKILDLSSAANQPMLSDDGRFVLVYNGEIYNYLELRKELASEGAIFRTHGDTEVVLQALIIWGPAAFTRFNGMWALALLDRLADKVILSRDRFGIKPLYIYRDKKGLLIASEIKAILKVTGRRFQVNPHVANAFLSQNLLCTNPTTFFLGIEEFPAGHWAEISVNEIDTKPLSPCCYWTVPSNPINGSDEDTLIESVRATFVDAVKLRLRSDVPVGVLLSGGTDSSAIAAVLHYLNPARHDIKLISAVAADGRDEQPFIDTVARYLSRDVEKVVLNYSPARALELMSEVSWFNDEPIHNFSTIAHYLLMNRARDLGVTVLLSGQGADEILCGYKKYLAFYIQELLSSGKWSTAAQVARTFWQRDTVLPQMTYREAKRYLPKWLRFPETDIRGPALQEANGWTDLGLNGKGVISRQIADLERFSIPAIVHYEDRMSMAVGREIRLPFLDYRFVESVVPLPVEFKMRAGWTKWIFRQAMEPFLPKEIAWRKDKQHFTVPQNEWFRSELQVDIFKLFETEWLTEELGLIVRQKFRARYNEYLRQPNIKGRLNFKDIFAPIALELWARCFGNYLSQ